MLPDQKAETTIGFLDQAVQFFARHGIGVRALLTDNGSNYRYSAVPPGLPENGHQTPTHPPLHTQNQRQGGTLHPDRAARMGLRRNTGTAPRKETCIFSPGTRYYNRERPHGSLNYKPPISRSDYGTTY